MTKPDGQNWIQRRRDELRIWLRDASPPEAPPHSMYAPRVTVGLTVFSITAFGLSIMAAGFIFWGWCITLIGGALTAWAFLHDRRNARVGEWVVAIFLMILAILLPFYLHHEHKIGESRSNKTNAEVDQIYQRSISPSSARALVSLTESCELAGLPIKVPAGSGINLLPTDLAYLKSNKWGIYRFNNDGENTAKFPDERTMLRLVKYFPPPFMTWKCMVTNHGSVNLSAVGIPIRVDFTGEKNSAVEQPFELMVGPIDASKSSEFYIVNDCPYQVFTIMPDTAAVEVAGSAEKFSVRLGRLYRNPVEQLGILWPSGEQWIHVSDCGKNALTPMQINTLPLSGQQKQRARLRKYFAALH